MKLFSYFGLDLKHMSKQYLFDRVHGHLMTQMEKSMSEDNPSRCMYRGRGGLSCAIGVLIEDKNYHESLEDQMARREAVVKAVSGSLGFNTSRYGNFLSELQDVHDDAPVYLWGHRLTTSARRHGLRPRPESPPSVSLRIKTSVRGFILRTAHKLGVAE